jgi:DNA sulfur modification protein DndB
MLRQEKINTHGVVLRALGGLGRALIDAYPGVWEEKLKSLRDIDWRKSVGNKVNPEWENVCITAGSVLSNRQARVATLAVLKGKVGLDLTGQETQFKSKRDAVGAE